ncbi:MAG TPA: hypothetical protein VF013_07530 [Candidatus Limnocylindria bacterium]
MIERAPADLRRYAVLAVLAVLAVFAVTLLVRPFIFSWSAPRDDSAYPLLATAEADAGPRLVEIVLNDAHGLLGEVDRDEQHGLTVVVAPLPGGEGYSVVGAWSPVGDCALTLAADRLTDCDGHAWTFGGVPLRTDDPPLQAFPTSERNGAVFADFTSPMDSAP